MINILVLRALVAGLMVMVSLVGVSYGQSIRSTIAATANSNSLKVAIATLPHATNQIHAEQVKQANYASPSLQHQLENVYISGNFKGFSILIKTYKRQWNIDVKKEVDTATPGKRFDGTNALRRMLDIQIADDTRAYIQRWNDSFDAYEKLKGSVT